MPRWGTHAFLSSPFIELGDPADDLAVATVLMMVGGKLVLLRPRKVSIIATFSLAMVLDDNLQ